MATERIVDLHVHSHYSRATSRDCTLEGLYRWGKLKGIGVIGTGDFTHPAWFAELQQKLEPAEPGLFRLHGDIAAPIDAALPPSVRGQALRFILSVEIAAVYQKGDKTRKLHQLVTAPSLETASQLNARLGRLGNLASDGRPVLGLDAKELLSIVLDTNERMFYMPAHIWTPWFGLFGSKSGFNSITEAYEELAPHITALETGLSSDPGMNWRVSDLDGRAITSHSDAHSPQKLGREATLVRSDLSYDDIIGAFRTNDARLAGTIEFFPQEGKYFADGHRAHGVRFMPEETTRLGGVCPVCHRTLTVGVCYRISELAARPEGYRPKSEKIVEHIIPLPEIIAEIQGVKSTASKRVTAMQFDAYARLGNEFDILRKVSIDHIREAGFPDLAVAIERLRNREVRIEPGYDGVYGTVALRHHGDSTSPSLHI